jgi:Xaa-Pro aminopeptidase
VLHYTRNEQACNDGDLLLCDFGAEYENYAADISRTFPVNGKFSGRQRDLYNLVLRVQKKAIAQLVPGTTLKKYNQVVAGFMEQELIAIGLLKEHEVRIQDPEKPLVKKYFMHGTAHHLGMDVHDVFDKHRAFEPGMVFTCEPGLYIREENTGIRIENNILITTNGPVDLSEYIPREPDDIEELMRI